MSFPLHYLLYIYYAFLAIWALFFLIGLFHMFKYGFKNFLSVAVTAIFIGVAALMLTTSFYYINTVEDWDESIQLLPDFSNMDVDL